MKDILVIADPVNNSDGDEQTAYHKALELAVVSNANLHVAVFCYESVSLSASDKDNSGAFSLESVLVEERELWWTDYIGKTQGDIQVSCEVIWEKYPHAWVIEHCKTRHYDLLVKTGHRSETAFYTPTDWQLFRKAPVPIYSVTQNHFKARKVVLAALDLMTLDEQKQRLNERLLEAAFQLSVQTASELHCCFAIKLPTLVRDLDLIDVPAHEHKIEKEARLKSQEWLDDYDINDADIHIEQGTPWRVVSSIAHRVKAHCVVIGSMGRTGVAGKLIGNTAEKVIQHAKTDLLVINPLEDK